MFGKEWRWRRDDGYGFVRLVLDAHHDWKNIDGGEDKVSIGRRTVGGLLMDQLVVTVYRLFPFGVEYVHIEVGIGGICCWGAYDRVDGWDWWRIWGVWLVG